MVKIGKKAGEKKGPLVNRPNLKEAMEIRTYKERSVRKPKGSTLDSKKKGK